MDPKGAVCPRDLFQAARSGVLVCIAPLSGAPPWAPSQLGVPTQGGAEQAWQRVGVGSLGVAGEGCTCRCVWVCAGVCTRVQACARMCGCVRMCVRVCACVCGCVQVSTAQPRAAGLWVGDPQPDPGLRTLLWPRIPFLLVALSTHPSPQGSLGSETAESGGREFAVTAPSLSSWL